MKSTSFLPDKDFLKVFNDTLTRRFNSNHPKYDYPNSHYPNCCFSGWLTADSTTKTKEALPNTLGDGKLDVTVPSEVVPKMKIICLEKPVRDHSFTVNYIFRVSNKSELVSPSSALGTVTSKSPAMLMFARASPALLFKLAVDGSNTYSNLIVMMSYCLKLQFDYGLDIIQLSEYLDFFRMGSGSHIASDN